MRRFRRRTLLCTGAATAVAALVAAGLWATQHEPAFYRRCLADDAQALERASDAMLERIAALTSQADRPGRFGGLFTAAEINGWLAVDLPRNHRDLLPAEWTQPRVALHPGEVKVAARYALGGWSTVVQLTASVYLDRPGVLAVRLRKLRAGRVPLPLGGVLAAISEIAAQGGWRLEWRQAGGEPVALFTLPQSASADAYHYRALEIGEGQVYISGWRGPMPPDGAIAASPPGRADDRAQAAQAVHDSVQTKRQH